jgi:hypothetical protein
MNELERNEEVGACILLKLLKSGLSVCSLFLLSAPVCAQDAHKTLLYSNYCATQSKTVSGWQGSLVKGDKNLNKFYWSPMTYGIHGQYSAYSKDSSKKRQKTFHELKPRVIPFQTSKKAPVDGSSAQQATVKPATVLSYHYDSQYNAPDSAGVSDERCCYKQPVVDGSLTSKNDTDRNSRRLAQVSGRIIHR